jgi:hypothetical protein
VSFISQRLNTIIGGMKTQYFCLKIDAGHYFQDANFEVSSPVCKSDIEDEIAKRLSVLELETDLRQLKFDMKNGFLQVSGWAHQYRHPSTSSLIM